MNRTLFLLALAATALCMGIELGSHYLLPAPLASGAEIESALQREQLADQVDLGEVLKLQSKPPRPGIGISFLALIDGILLLTLALMGGSLIIPERIHGRVQGLVSLAGAVVALAAGVTMLFAGIGLLLLMLSLFLSAPFGTIAYLAAWGFFDRGGAAAILGLLMMLKIAAGVFLFFAHPRFIQNRGLVLLLLTSLLATAVVSVLHGWVPLVLVSIADALGAIVAVGLGLLWSLALLLFSVVSLVKVFRVTRTANSRGA